MFPISSTVRPCAFANSFKCFITSGSTCKTLVSKTGLMADLILMGQAFMFPFSSLPSPAGTQYHGSIQDRIYLFFHAASCASTHLNTLDVCIGPVSYYSSVAIGVDRCTSFASSSAAMLASVAGGVLSQNCCFIHCIM